MLTLPVQSSPLSRTATVDAGALPSPAVAETDLPRWGGFAVSPGGGATAPVLPDPTVPSDAAGGRRLAETLRALEAGAPAHRPGPINVRSQNEALVRAIIECFQQSVFSRLAAYAALSQLSFQVGMESAQSRRTAAQTRAATMIASAAVSGVVQVGGTAMSFRGSLDKDKLLQDVGGKAPLAPTVPAAARPAAPVTPQPADAPAPLPPGDARRLAQPQSAAAVPESGPEPVMSSEPVAPAVPDAVIADQAVGAAPAGDGAPAALLPPDDARRLAQPQSAAAAPEGGPDPVMPPADQVAASRPPTPADDRGATDPSMPDATADTGPSARKAQDQALLAGMLQPSHPELCQALLANLASRRIDTGQALRGLGEVAGRAVNAAGETAGAVVEQSAQQEQVGSEAMKHAAETLRAAFDQANKLLAEMIQLLRQSGEMSAGLIGGIRV